MDYKEIATADDGFYYLVTNLRRQIINAIDEVGLRASPKKVRDTLDIIMPEPVTDGFKSWFEQRPALEEMLITTFLDVIVRMNMEVDRDPNERYGYALKTEGRCGDPSHNQNERDFGFVDLKKPIANIESYTLDDLVQNWKEIFIFDEQIEGNENVRGKYAPRCEHGETIIPAAILSTQHQLRLVNSEGKYLGKNIAFCRTKSGANYIFKMAELLTGVRYNGKVRDSIDDYLAATIRGIDPAKTWVGVIESIKRIAKEYPEKLDGMLRFQGYTRDDIKDLRRELENDPNVGGFVGGRGDLEFNYEKTPKNKRMAKYGEIWLPCGPQDNVIGSNKIEWQVFNDNDYTKMQGDRELNHKTYKSKREAAMLKGLTAWHWDIARRLAPYFVDKYLLGGFNVLYEPYLSLDAFKSKPK